MCCFCASSVVISYNSRILNWFTLKRVTLSVVMKYPICRRPVSINNSKPVAARPSTYSTRTLSKNRQCHSIMILNNRALYTFTYSCIPFTNTTSKILLNSISHFRFIALVDRHCHRRVAWHRKPIHTHTHTHTHTHYYIRSFVDSEATVFACAIKAYYNGGVCMVVFFWKKSFLIKRLHRHDCYGAERVIRTNSFTNTLLTCRRRHCHPNTTHYIYIYIDNRLHDIDVYGHVFAYELTWLFLSW